MSLTNYAVTALIAALFTKCLPDHAGIYLLTALGGILLAKVVSSKLNNTHVDVYELDHAVLNIQPPSTMWLNMGYWRDTTSFPAACEALAVKLGKHAGIQPDDRILDVGCGCGSSTALWATQFKALEVRGVTAVPSHVEQAKQFISSHDDIPMEAKVEVHVGDGVEYTKQLANKGEKFDRVIALDCAYHFSTRRAFLKEAEAILEFTGTIGLTDLMLPSTPLSPISTLLLRIICFLASVPFENLVTQEVYKATFNELGFTELVIEDITPHVFNGLAGYIDRINQDVRLKAALDPAKMLQYRLFAKILRWWSNGRLRFVIVKAMKGVKRR